MDNNVLFSPQDKSTLQGNQGNPVVGSPSQASQQVGNQVSFSPSQPAQNATQSVGQIIQPVSPVSPVQPVSSPSQVAATPLNQPLQGSFVPQPSSLPSTMEQMQEPADAIPDGPRITLQDLYGNSANTQMQSSPAPMPGAFSHVEEVTTPSVASPVEEMVNQNQTQDPEPSIQEPVKVEEIAPVLQGRSEASADSSPEIHSDRIPMDSGGGGFHFPPILLKLVGGLIVILILIVIISFVSSLFKKGPGNEKVTLTYWGLWEDSNVMQGVINDFQRQHPNITVTYTKQDPIKYTDRLLTRIQNGSGPDIFRFHNTWVTPLQNVLAPLPSTIIDKKQLQQNYFPVVTTDLVRNGAIYGLPLEMDNLVLYTNKDIFDHAGAKVPSTWEDFVTVAKGLTVKDGAGHIKTAGAAIGTYENVTHAPDIISLLLLQNGANLQKLQGSQNATDALSFYTSFSKTDDRVWDNTLDTSLLAFSRGKVAMYFGYSYDYFAIKAASSQLNFEIHPVPHLPGRDMSVASYWVEGVSSKGKHQNEALLFLKYLSQRDVMARLYTEEAKTRQFGEIYPRIDLASNLSSDPILATFVNQASKAVSSPFASDTQYDSFNGGLNRYLGNAVNSLLNNTSADTALSTLAQGLSQIFNQYANPSQ